ncbi:hypothetical protein L7D48_06390 [Streptomyces sp. S1A]|uniref:Uncharacterized protein n=1 Tax=Streptomyces chitinivorans TaxID=1257027 RepID=A0ABW7HMB3_9ACTN|nr:MULTISPECIES: hypothetical protein [Streptomyces]MCG3040198.1 hypothetical protein [Streptomyces sp. ICN903]MDH2410858.1 hypothetical protein [Streptomyces chitinivorans]
MSVSEALSSLVAALTEHAEVMSEQNVPPERAVDVIERVRAAAARYSDETFESSGWGSPFSDMFEEEDVDAESGVGEVPDGAERISVTGRWDFVVSDRDAWIAYVNRRLEEVGASDCAPGLSSAAQAAHEILTHSDPFGAYTSHGLAEGGKDWGIEQVSKTLSEMTDEERYA